MKKSINKIISILILIVMCSSIITSAAINDDSINLDPKEIEYIAFSNDVYLGLKDVMNNISSYKNSNDITIIYETIDSLSSITDNLTLSNLQKHKPNDQFDYCYYSILDLLLTNPNTEKNEALIYLADKLYYSTIIQIKKGYKGGITFDSYVTWAFINSYSTKKGLIYKSYGKKTAEIFKIIYINCYMLINNPDSVIDDTITNFIPSTDVTDSMLNSELVIPNEDDLLDDFVQDNDGNSDTSEDTEIDNDTILDMLNNQINTNLSQNYTLNYYQAIDNKCYKITVVNKDGFISSTYNSVAKSEYVYCNIYDYVENKSEGSFVNRFLSSLIKKLRNRDKNLSDKTIHYTLNGVNAKDGDYKNTKIRVYRDDTVDYDMIKSSLSIIAKDVEDSHILKDRDAYLVILDGKPYYTYKDTDNKYFTKETVEAIFDKSEDIKIKIFE